MTIQQIDDQKDNICNAITDFFITTIFKKNYELLSKFPSAKDMTILNDYVNFNHFKDNQNINDDTISQLIFILNKSISDNWIDVKFGEFITFNNKPDFILYPLQNLMMELLRIDEQVINKIIGVIWCCVDFDDVLNINSNEKLNLPFYIRCCVGYNSKQFYLKPIANQNIEGIFDVEFEDFFE